MVPVRDDSEPHIGRPSGGVCCYVRRSSIFIWHHPHHTTGEFQLRPLWLVSFMRGGESQMSEGPST